LESFGESAKKCDQKYCGMSRHGGCESTEGDGTDYTLQRTTRADLLEVYNIMNGVEGLEDTVSLKEGWNLEARANYSSFDVKWM